MPSVEVPVIGPAYADSTLPINAQEAVNLYLKSGGPGGTDALVGTPGLKLLATTENAAVRGMISAEGFLWLVVGSNLYKVNVGSGVSTLIGAVSGSNDEASMAYSFTELMIVRGDAGFIYNFSTEVLTQITDVDFPSVANTVTFIDGYFVVSSENGRLYSSDLNDGTSWDALYFTTAEGAPDEIQAVIADHRELFALCETSVEIYDNIGGSDFPFAIRDGAFMEQGTIAPYSVAKADNSIVWLANSRLGEVQVVRMLGYQPVVISNPAIEDEIKGYVTVTDAIAMAYKWGGRLFYTLTFPTEDVTWECDLSVGDPQLSWHKRKSWGMGRWRVSAHAAIGTKNYFGDYTNGNVYVLDTSTYTENGVRIERIRTFPHYPPATYHSLEVEFEAGVGLTSGQGSDPKVSLSWSGDRGKTYGNILQRGIGKIGEYDDKAIWNKLGRSEKARTFKLYYSEPTRFAILKANLKATPIG